MKVVLNNRDKRNLCVSGAIILAVVAFVSGCFVGFHGAQSKARAMARMSVANYEDQIQELEKENVNLKFGGIECAQYTANK